MTEQTYLLVGTALSLGFIHTLLGPDHYLPFVVLAKARRWSTLKTAWITVLCAMGHVGSSILLGVLGILAGTAVSKLDGFESTRGTIAAWLLIGFGLLYFLWGLRAAVRGHRHQHHHVHPDGATHVHDHSHEAEHAHLHEGKSLTPWVLFLIFVFGPCEPLIPLLMVPAATQSGLGSMAIVCLAFALATTATMLVTVLGSEQVLERLPLRKVERYSHALAGFAILLCGLGIQFLGL